MGEQNALTIPGDILEPTREHLSWLKPLLTEQTNTRENHEQIFERFASMEDEDRRAVAIGVLTVARWAEQRSSYGLAYYHGPMALLLSRFSRHRLNWTSQQTAWLIEVVLERPNSFTGVSYPTLSMTVRALQRLDDASWRSLAPRVERLQQWLHQYDFEFDTRYVGARRRVDQLVAKQQGQLPIDDRVVGQGPLAEQIAEMLKLLGPERSAHLVELLRDYGDATAPSDRWLKAARAAALADPKTVDAVRGMLNLIPALSDPRDYYTPFLDAAAVDLCRSGVWYLAASPTEDAVALLRDVVLKCVTKKHNSGGKLLCSPIAFSAVASLEHLSENPDIDRDVVVAAFAAIDGTGNAKFRRIVADALRVVADRAGVEVSELLERSVPTLGFTPDGSHTLVVGDYVATSRVVVRRSRGSVETLWRSTTTGRSVKTIPTAVREGRPDVVDDLRLLKKNVARQVATQRARLERLVADDRVWRGQDVLSCYFDHPLVGIVARELVWEVQQQGTWFAGLPVAAAGVWQLERYDGRTVPVEPEGTLRLWHPVRERLAQVKAWRAHLTEQELHQSVRQVFREIYLLTPAEEQTRVYSNRFAAHVLMYRPMGALMKARGWRADHLGPWEDGDQARATKQLPSGRQAVFFYDRIESELDRDGTPYLCGTDQVRVECIEGAAHEGDPVPLVEVSPLEFSEAMRDVDLFVGVASIANDPAWSDRGVDRHLTYWHNISFGPMDDSAKMRRTALAQLLPRTDLRDCARLEGNYLVVQGGLREYKIHLGSTNILMSPADTYLCIVNARTDLVSRIFLPFEEDDGKLASILSKAFLLADDESITDPAIATQIRHGL